MLTSEGSLCLNQSSRAWFGKFSDALIQFGMRCYETDHFVFFRLFNMRRVILIIYVDDIIVTGDDSKGIEKLKTFLQTQFHTKDLGKLW